MKPLSNASGIASAAVTKLRAKQQTVCAKISNSGQDFLFQFEGKKHTGGAKHSPLDPDY